MAVEAGSKLLTALFGNWMVVALLALDDVEAAVKRGRDIRHRILPGPAGMVIPFVGTCARCSARAGDFVAAKRQLEQMFALCRTVEWANFDLFCGLYLRIALDEGRQEAAARLLGFATAVAKRSAFVDRHAGVRDEAHAVLAPALGPARLAQLCAESEGLDHESVCALTLQGLPAP